MKIPDRFLQKKTSPETMHGFLIAEDDDLARVFDGMKSTAFKLGPKYISTDKPFDVARFASDD